MNHIEQLQKSFRTFVEERVVEVENLRNFEEVKRDLYDIVELILFHGKFEDDKKKSYHGDFDDAVGKFLIVTLNEAYKKGFSDANLLREQNFFR